MPETVDNIDNCSITALLIDEKGEVINARRSKIEVYNSVATPTVECGATKYYDLLGRPVGSEYKGFRIEVQPNGSVKKTVEK